MATKPAGKKTSAKQTGAAPAPAKANKPSDDKATDASPFDEMGAEDESPGDAHRSENKAAPTPKKRA